MVRPALERFGRIDGLVNAAALSDRGSVLDADMAFFDHLFAVNARGPMFLMQGVIRHLRQRKAPGAIVNILSVNAHGGTPELAVYGATKAAMALLTKNAAYSHRFDRIRVNGINLGWADTPGERAMQGDKLGKGEGWLAEAEAAMPWGRLDQARGRRPAGGLPPQRRLDPDDGLAGRPGTEFRAGRAGLSAIGRHHGSMGVTAPEPLNQDTRLATTFSPMARIVSVVELAMCGVRTTLSKLRSAAGTCGSS